jgi:hypothetical protein
MCGEPARHRLEVSRLRGPGVVRARRVTPAQEVTAGQDERVEATTAEEVGHLAAPDRPMFVSPVDLPPL